MNLSHTLIIPTYNGAQTLPKLIQSLKNAQQHNHQVLFIDSQSQDDTPILIQQAGYRFHTIPKHQFDHAGTRSLAATLTDTDLVIYMTQDAYLAEADSLQTLTNVFQNPHIGAAYGRQLPHHDATPFARHLRHFNYPPTSHCYSLANAPQHGIKTAFLSNSYAAYRRTAMDQIDWFKQRLILGEDTYAGAKLLNAGYHLAYVAESCVYHSHNYTLKQEFQRYRDIGQFHRDQNWIIQQFGKPQGEGWRYVKSELKYLKNNPLLQLQSLCRTLNKYLAYQLGYLIGK